MAAYIDVTDATFQTEVIDRSHQVPVLVDLWAEWCGPCRTLGPILEQVVGETDGAMVLAKVDVDANPAIANAFRAQSIPAVHLIVGGRPVDGFMGAQPEQTVREFVQRNLPEREPTEIERLIANGDEASLRAALEIESDHADAVVALAELLAVDGRHEEALELLARIPESAETRRVAAFARLGGVDGPAGDADVEAELAELLTSVKTDDAARQRFIDLLELLGPEDPRTPVWRKRLTTTLF